MEKLTRTETWEALESLTRIYFVQVELLLKDGAFEIPSGDMVFGEANGPDFDMIVVFAPKKVEACNKVDSAE